MVNDGNIFDQYDEIDDAVNRNLVNNALINLPPFILDEVNNINKRKIALDWESKTKVWKRLPGSLDEPVEKYQSDYKGEGMKVFVKVVAIIEEEVKVILGNIMHFNSNR